jgi:hypothetical protein
MVVERSTSTKFKVRILVSMRFDGRGFILYDIYPLIDQLTGFKIG